MRLNLQRVAKRWWLAIALVVAAGVLMILRGDRLVDWFNPPAHASFETICPGDVVPDGERNVLDLVRIQAHVLGNDPLSGDPLMAADVNQDGSVDVLDVVRLSQHLTRRRILADCRGNLAVSPASLDFGGVRLTTSRDLTFTVSNTGNGLLNVTGVSSDNARFTVPAPALPFTVAPAGTRAVTVRYAPTAETAHTGTLTVSGNSAGATLTATVSLCGFRIGGG